MTHISGFERSQLLLLPESIDDYVGVDNPVRFIDAFVDELDLAAAGFVRAEAKATGRPTRIKAVNNKDRNFTRNSLQDFIRAADERLDDYLRRLDEGDVEEGGTGGGARTKNLAGKIAALREKRGRYGALRHPMIGVMLIRSSGSRSRAAPRPCEPCGSRNIAFGNLE
jgi:hypothetical protein